ncbi:ADP-ribose pyrophosphatase, mitochondrial isoform X1 [Entelurus aequoreus]|uniref:ADP-ribose pyrophosphatase, mitochondrial isoform X1 n=1 Tax=Entelurus aequoreus TaxID=161455 RepID=UPI002B1DF34E|nr:ADP-ribose pyrophosphatase, mitochondrial isoform X1 [Entelurus aequoreus]XP_061893300.1 ADP-ribose pyrophosphatase, mitochondrial isoform X1 [Entelurus aequoreus]
MLRHNYLSSIRLALTLFDFPVYTSGFRSAISCLDGQPLRATPSTSRPFSKTCVPTMKASVSPHMKSRCPEYPGSQIKRFPVSDAQVDWSHSVQGYEPVHFTHPAVAKKPAWADPEIGSFCPQFNTVDGAVDRRSFEGRYKVEDGKPLNPHGRTGLSGRGLLGRWGPNHAADPIVTRWKVDAQGEKIHHLVSKKPILQFVSIKRKDCGEWAIPGGMVDPGEQISLTLQREFSEEALNSLAVPPSERENIRQRINRLFQSGGFQVFEGYVDDPRNTDNAWMETVAINFHDENGNCVSELPLQAGDDAGQVQWVDVDSSFLLYASHSHLLQMVVTERNAHW